MTPSFQEQVDSFGRGVQWLVELELEGIVELQAVKADSMAVLASTRAVRGMGEWVAEPIEASHAK